MKRLISLLLILILLLSGCKKAPTAQVAATTLPVYEFTVLLCEGTDITVTRLITENVSCLHDYTLNVDQMKAISGAELVIMNGAGLEGFMEDALNAAPAVIDASTGISYLDGKGHSHEHGHEEHDHHHSDDPHIWLSPQNARIMVQNIYTALCQKYPQHQDIFQANLRKLMLRFDELEEYAEKELSTLQCRQIITFHDGFAYMAQSFGLTILRAVEEESGSEASAAELKELITMVKEHQLPAVFTERNGSVSAAHIIARETGCKVFSLDMAMSGDSYFDAMYHNINTLKEALQ